MFPYHDPAAEAAARRGNLLSAAQASQLARLARMSRQASRSRRSRPAVQIRLVPRSRRAGTHRKGRDGSPLGRWLRGLRVGRS
jgi:hypothetical protein